MTGHLKFAKVGIFTFLVDWSIIENALRGVLKADRSIIGAFATVREIAPSSYFGGFRSHSFPRLPNLGVFEQIVISAAFFQDVSSVLDASTLCL